MKMIQNAEGEMENQGDVYFFDGHGIIHYEFVSPQQTISAVSYKGVMECLCTGKIVELGLHFTKAVIDSYSTTDPLILQF